MKATRHKIMVIQIPKCSKRKRININALYVKDFKLAK